MTDEVLLWSNVTVYSLPEHVHGPGGRMGNRPAEPEQRALARAVRSEHGPVLARPHGEADAADDLAAVPAVGDVLKFKH